MRIVPALVALATLALLPAGASAQKPTCHGLPVTITKSKGLIIGTPKRDVIRLTGRGTVLGRGGNDVICGSRFADRINGGTGNDVVLGGGGPDRIHGGLGGDQLFGENGGDWINGGPGRNTIVPGAGRNTVVPARRGGPAARQALNTVIPGTYAVSVAIPPQGTFQFGEQGMEIGLARVTQPPLVPIAATAPALQYTGFALGDYGVSLSGGPLVPGAIPRTLQIESASIGTGWTITPANLLTMNFGSGNPVGMLVESESQGMTTVGLAQDIAPFGSPPSFGEILYDTLEPFETVTLIPPSTIALFTTPQGSNGLLLPELPQSAAIVRVTRANPTAAFSWSPADGRFVTD